MAGLTHRHRSILGKRSEHMTTKLVARHSYGRRCRPPAKLGDKLLMKEMYRWRFTNSATMGAAFRRTIRALRIISSRVEHLEPRSLVRARSARACAHGKTR